MKYSKIIFIVLFASNFMNCKSQSITTSELIETKALMSKVFNTISSNQLNPSSIENKILTKPSTAKYNSWKDIIEESDLILTMAIDYKAKTNEDRINFSKIFTKNEIEHMSQQVEQNIEKTWEQYLGMNPNNKNSKNRNKDNLITYYLTIPVFTTFKEYSLIYKESRYGGTLVVYKNNDGKWSSIASSIVWIN